MEKSTEETLRAMIEDRDKALEKLEAKNRKTEGLQPPNEEVKSEKVPYSEMFAERNRDFSYWWMEFTEKERPSLHREVTIARFAWEAKKQLGVDRLEELQRLEGILLAEPSRVPELEAKIDEIYRVHSDNIQFVADQMKLREDEIVELKATIEVMKKSFEDAASGDPGRGCSALPDVLQKYLLPCGAVAPVFWTKETCLSYVKTHNSETRPFPPPIGRFQVNMTIDDAKYLMSENVFSGAWEEFDAVSMKVLAEFNTGWFV